MKNKSEASKLSDWIRENCSIRGNSIANRRLKYGVGINDADYVTKPVINGKETRCPAYKAWHHMLLRAYNQRYNTKHPTYGAVTVCDEWLIFSNFRRWFIENHVDCCELDKDILSKENKIYSPETCIYVPQWLNKFTTNRKSKRGKYLIGVSWDLKSDKFRAQVSNCNPAGNKKEYLGVFDNELEAYNAWLTRKLEIALELKPEMDIIDLRIYPNVVEIIKNMK